MILSFNKVLKKLQILSRNSKMTNDPGYDDTYDRLYKEVMEEFPNMQHHDAALLVYARWYELDNS